MAILDDVIGVFSPGWKAARLRSRAVIQAYEAVKTTRTHKARREKPNCRPVKPVRGRVVT